MMMPMARAATTSDVFNAIAEPQRREILELLRAGERPVTELAQELGMTQPGASKHLRVLREVGLVRDRREGKQRVYGLDARDCDRFTSGPAGSSGSGTLLPCLIEVLHIRVQPVEALAADREIVITGASVMGRRMFDLGEQAWPEEAPFHTPVFVVTHEKRDPWQRPGGTTFHFVNDGIEPALDQARDAAGDRDVRIAGGGATILEYVNAGLVYEFSIARHPCCSAPESACSRAWTRAAWPWSRSARSRRSG